MLVSRLFAMTMLHYGRQRAIRSFGGGKKRAAPTRAPSPIFVGFLALCVGGPRTHASENPGQSDLFCNISLWALVAGVVAICVGGAVFGYDPLFVLSFIVVVPLLSMPFIAMALLVLVFILDALNSR
jgi:hypothetical protein